ncbi:MAG: hypothetical protein M3457_09025 [Chloroflexota bacterium]|nr:hypothetical protein [Chloroflexota bacterium]
MEGAVRLGTAGPFAPAARLLQWFTGVVMSPATLRRLTLAAGTTMRQLELDFTATVRDTGGVVADVADVPLHLSLDGSMVALVDEGWREVKLAAIGDRAGTGPLTDLTYAATLGSADAFGDEALGELGRRGVPQATDVVTVNEGAEWIQGFVDLHCPQAHRVLDVAHAAGYLAAAATATFGEGTDAATAWFQTQRRELRDGDPDLVLAALGALPAGETRDTARGYLTARRMQIADRAFRARGWPIGSGCVESGHKGVVQGRLKGQGMRWTRPVAAGMIALRIVDANARWGMTWAQVGTRQRADHRAPTAARRTARRTRPPTPKLVQAGKPPADHPWRTLRLPGSPRFSAT